MPKAPMRLRFASFEAAEWTAGTLVSLAAFFVACSSSDPRDFDTAGARSSTRTPGGPCASGSTRACVATLSYHDGVLTCYEGTQVCAGGAWGSCEGGEAVHRAAPAWLEELDAPPAAAPRGGSGVAEPGREAAVYVAKPLSFSGPVACMNNPCDPTCQTYDEQPEGGIVAEPTGKLYDWSSGDPYALPASIVAEAIHVPCTQALDCQLDMHCDNPASGSCTHHPCVAGTGLEASCSPCVSDICAVDPTCCDPSPGSWSAACVARVHDVCGAFCEEDAACSHDKCYPGEFLGSACDPCVGQICGTDPFCCSNTGAWDEFCVAEVQAICGQSCPKVGQCVPWVAGETDEACGGADLTVGVPCADSIPICNRGTAEAPAGVRVVHFPEDAQQLATCSPDLSVPGVETCVTTQPIPPGQCIDLSGCPNLAGAREIMVNPPGAAAVAECTCQNNWAIYAGGQCEEPSCSGVSSEATIRKVNLFFQIDKSGSMAWNGWSECMGAVKAFVKDPSSAGLGVALRFWPDGAPVPGCDGTSCSIDACATPLVPLGTLTTDASPSDAQETALVSAINSKSPGGATPMFPAVGGATTWAVNHRQAHPEEEAAVVLITDGEPTQCDTDVDHIASLAGNAFLGYGVRTYVIGIEAASLQPTLDKIAKYGGTGKAFLVPKGGGGAANTALLDALNKIKGSAVSCDLPIPDAGLFDAKNAKLTFAPSVGAPVVLEHVDGASDCASGGWYYDDVWAPTKITLCPSTCDTAKADAGARIHVSLACPGTYEPYTHHEIYKPSCPQGTKVQWGYLAYDSVTPKDSNVELEARVADDTGPWSPAMHLATADAASGTEVCAMGGPAPCPVDLYAQLGLPNARRDVLDLMITLNPSSDTLFSPAVKTWQITYSCPDDE